VVEELIGWKVLMHDKEESGLPFCRSRYSQEKKKRKKNDSVPGDLMRRLNYGWI
jgi:hypothetical protein